MTSTLSTLAGATAVALALATADIAAGEHARTFASVPPGYQQECASCHIAYPPQLLPPASWQRLIAGLSHHFGTDASVDPATAADLDAWLTAHAGKRKHADTAPPEDRITRSAWFVRKHRGVPAETWTRTAVGRPSNCAACHRDAARGQFDETSISIPNGAARP
jgi:hypothetical protein